MTVDAQPLSWLRSLRDDPSAVGSGRLAVLAMVAARVSGSTGSGFCSYKQLATNVGCSEDVVKRAVTWALSAGYLSRTSRGHRRGDGSLAASGYQLTLPSLQGTEAPLTRTGAGSLQGDSRPQQGGRTPPKGFISTRGKDTRSARPTVIDPAWTANEENRSLAARLGLDLERAERLFVLGAVGSGEKRRDWNSTFGGFLHAVAEDRAGEEFAWVSELGDSTTVAAAPTANRPGSRTGRAGVPIPASVAVRADLDRGSASAEFQRLLDGDTQTPDRADPNREAQ